jgi:hypothetical protein
MSGKNGAGRRHATRALEGSVNVWLLTRPVTCQQRPLPLPGLRAGRAIERAV